MTAAPVESNAATLERTVIFLISAVQFINILEFMMVMPLGPDFAAALNIPMSQLGIIGGSYTAAAAVSGILASLFVERFDRRKALAGAMLGLVCSTLAAGLAVDLPTLLLARICAGLFGGPASALSMAIIADTIPPERRGRAMGIVMGSFSLASVIGVPAGLELARMGGWRMPFYAVSALGLLIAGMGVFRLPSMTKHLELRAERVKAGAAAEPHLGAYFLSLLTRGIALNTLLLTIVTMSAGFMLIPNMAAFIQGNLGYPRDGMSVLYLCGGIFSFGTMRLVGRLVDRYGSVPVASVGSALFVATVFVGFIGFPPPPQYVIVLFTVFMVAASCRMVPYQALVSQVPDPDERARFMSVLSSVQHVSAASGAFLSSQLLSEGPNGSLVGIEHVAWISVAFGAVMPLVMRGVQKKLRASRQPTKLASAA